jgi:hypothetical protein
MAEKFVVDILTYLLVLGVPECENVLSTLTDYDYDYDQISLEILMDFHVCSL